MLGLWVWITDFVSNKRIFPPLCQSLALVVSGGLQVSLQTFLLRLQLLGVVGLQALAGADVLQLLQQLLLLVDENEAVSLRVQQPWPRLAVQFGDLHFDGGDPEKTYWGKGRRQRHGTEVWSRSKERRGKYVDLV